MTYSQVVLVSQVIVLAIIVTVAVKLILIAEPIVLVILEIVHVSLVIVVAIIIVLVMWFVLHRIKVTGVLVKVSVRHIKQLVVVVNHTKT